MRFKCLVGRVALGLHPRDVDTGSDARAGARRGRAVLEGLCCSPLRGLPDPSPVQPSVEDFLHWWVGAGGEDGVGEFALSPFLISPGVSFLGGFVFQLFLAPWPLCGERCQIMKPVSKAGISVL